MAEVLNAHIDSIRSSDILERLNLKKNGYILLSAHREENIDTDENFYSLFNAINSMAKTYDVPVLYSCHPRSAKKIKEKNFKLDERVIMHEPLGFYDYNKLQMNALAVVSDSGTLPEESSYYLSIGNPLASVAIRTSTERPEAMDKGNFILSGISEREVLRSVEMAIAMKNNNDLGIPVPDYLDLNVSLKVVKLIESYTGIINRMVWRKQ